MVKEIQQTTFESDILKGLSANPKYLFSKYFYDPRGSKIFEDIMRMPEYYLTDCELEVFQTHKQQIARTLRNTNGEFELIELGAGDGLKTKILLAHLLENNYSFKYIPIDISKKAIHGLEKDLQKEFPSLEFNGLIGDYFQLIAKLNGTKRKLVLFLGSNIGNFREEESIWFLKHLRRVLNPGDRLLTGFDLKKDPRIILTAYNDPHGHTAAFNLNLLHRINRELGADFEVDDFSHAEIYDPLTGTAESYLISNKVQQIRIAKLGRTFSFEKDERVFMEISQKYDMKMIEALADNSGFEIMANFYDTNKWFVNSLWKAKKQ